MEQRNYYQPRHKSTGTRRYGERHEAVFYVFYWGGIIMSLFASTLFTQSAEARMYQWTQPNSGHTYLSGKAPSWYRGQTDGPRVLVFENGQIVDDTAARVSETQRVQLRTLAFTPKIVKPDSTLSLRIPQDIPTNAENVRHREREQMAAQGSLPVVKRQNPLLNNEPPPGIESFDTGKTPINAQQPSVLEQVLKTIISKWDQQQETTARRLLTPDSNNVPDPMAAPDVLETQP
jgi:hypothetical protein